MKIEKTKKHVEQMKRIKEDITSCLKIINKNIIECHDDMFDNYQHFFRWHASVLYRCEIKNEYYNQLLKEINNGDLETIQAYMMDVISTLTQEPQVKVKPIHQPRSIEKKEDAQVVYLYDFEATAGLKALFDNNKQNIIDTIKIPNLPKCDGAIRIVGDSMYPLLKSGDIILYKQQSPDMNNLLYGEMYLLSYDIDGEDYIVVKYIRKSEKGEPFVTLGSENPAYAARDIDFRRITALACEEPFWRNIYAVCINKTNI